MSRCQPREDAAQAGRGGRRPALLAAAAAVAVSGFAPGGLRAAELGPGPCIWTSEVSPEALIRFQPQTQPGLRRGELFFRRRRVSGFEVGTSLGYGTSWWGLTPQSEGRGDRVVWFRGPEPLRSLPSPGPAADRLLITGLGSALWYRGDQRLRREPTLIQAAEGFWRMSPTCPEEG
ncbi:hypothetical protein EVJ50_13045 [Synechococcus sp. RSCCF101]|uniref:hypothetical protein n=1 Tax=Synechococcus sp. RSCCF101 TaxID=2511069 RepID=UPI0012A1B684|nr:hypothetical protein [Synechococcus sp. RSCCF101]QEY33014.1 hypothetical protein EVJ50_13045 [Synechococcus sp. RSCCF101]